LLKEKLPSFAWFRYTTAMAEREENLSTLSLLTGNLSPDRKRQEASLVRREKLSAQLVKTLFIYLFLEN
jgi:hypothetical protein